MFQRDSSLVLRNWKVKRGTGFIVTMNSGEEGQDDEELELGLEKLELEEGDEVSRSASEGESNNLLRKLSIFCRQLKFHFQLTVYKHHNNTMRLTIQYKAALTTCKHKFVHHCKTLRAKGEGSKMAENLQTSFIEHAQSLKF